MFKPLDLSEDSHQHKQDYNDIEIVHIELQQTHFYVQRDMLTGIKESHMTKVFSKQETHFVLDRCPDTFNKVLEHLRSDGEYRPKQDDIKEYNSF